MPRADAILARFPAHLEATRPGKLLRHLTAALARDLDVQTASMAAIRRAHRLGEVEEFPDLLLIAGLHGLRASDLEILLMRFERAQARIADVTAATSAEERADAAAALLGLWGLESGTGLGPFAPGDDEADPDGEQAAQRLSEAAVRAVAHFNLMAAGRRRVAHAIQILTQRAGTVAAILHATANALDLEPEPGSLTHSDDRYLHAILTRDRVRLRASAEDDAILLPAAREVVAVEENPTYRAGTDEIGRRHGERFDLLRRGFEPARLEIRVTGENTRTYGPVVVNRDQGRGVGFAGAVRAGATLVFREDGRVKLEGLDVTAFAFAFEGACFADAAAPLESDFSFDSERARYVQATPAGALDRGFSFPHAGASLPVPGPEIAVGITRFAFFLQEAHASLAVGTPGAESGRLVTPRTSAGLFDASVFVPAAGEERPVGALVSFFWLERRAYAARIVIPPRFRNYDDDPEGTVLRQSLARTLGRFRPAGVALEIAFADERWTLGQGVLSTAADDDPLAVLPGGTVLWSAPDPPSHV